MKKFTYVILMLTIMLSIGCNKNDSVNLNPPPPGATPITPGVTTTLPNQVELTIVSSDVLSEYAKWPLNNPTNIRLGMSLNDFGAPATGAAHRYGGSLAIAFQDSGYNISSQFTTGGSVNDAIYNYWTTINGKSVFRAFFEDSGRPTKKVAGGLVLVIDNNNDLGDGGSSPLVNGSIWFLNFEDSYAPQTDKRCWFVSLGPYDCRAFISGDTINMESRLYPELRTLSTGYSPGYKKLGTFNNLDLYKAFNQ